jgi:hypothetical protein
LHQAPRTTMSGRVAVGGGFGGAGGDVSSLSRAALVCENWFAITDQRLPAVRINVDGGMFLVGPSGIEYAPMGDQSAAGLSAAVSAHETAHHVPSRLALENKAEAESAALTMKALQAERDRGSITEERFEQRKHALKLEQLERLREQLAKGLVSTEAFKLEVAKVVDEHRSAPAESELRITHFGTQQELMQLLERLREFLDSGAGLRPAPLSEAAAAAAAAEAGDDAAVGAAAAAAAVASAATAASAAAAAQTAVIEVVKSRFAIRASGGLVDGGLAGGLGGDDDEDEPERTRRREEEITAIVERRVKEQHATTLERRRTQASLWLLSELGAHSTVPGVELADHNMTKCDRVVRAIVEEVQKDDPDIVVTPALQTCVECVECVECVACRCVALRACARVLGVWAVARLTVTWRRVC